MSATPMLRSATLQDIPALAEAMVPAANFSIPGRNLGDELYDLEKDVQEARGNQPPGKIRTQFEEQMKMHNVWLAEVEAGVAGGIAWRDTVGCTPGEILSLFVHPRFHGRGIGTLLLHHAKKHALGHSLVTDGEVLMEVRCFEKNPRALKFYERGGFVRRESVVELVEEVGEYLALLVWLK
ncbi:acyl-CoA N-acyltransferase, partial [Roridomyces roridus]